MALPPVKGAKWNMKCRRQSWRKFSENTNFISRLSVLPPDDKSKVWREWIVIHFEFSQFVNWKNYPCPKLLSLHIFFRVQFASGAGEQILGEEFLGKSTNLFERCCYHRRSARHPSPGWERTKAFFFLKLFHSLAPALVSLFDYPLRVVLGWGTF